MTPLRILAVQEAYPPVIGGLERHAETVSCELAARGHDVTVATTHPPVEAESHGVRRIGLRMLAARIPQRLYSPDQQFVQHPPAPDPLTVVDLRRALRELRPDVVHARSWMLHSLLAAVRGARVRPRIVVSVHDYFPICATRSLLRDGRRCGGPRLARCVACASQASSLPVALYKVAGVRTGRHALAGVDRWLAVSEDVRQSIARVIPGGVAAIEVVGSTVPDSVFDAPAAGARRPVTGDYLLFVGSVRAFKGVDVLLEAHSRLGPDRPALVLIGKGSLGGDYAPDVRHVGPLPHDRVMSAWHGALAGVAPSIWPEPFGQVAVEAMASGTPIVATDTGGLRDVVVDEHTGLLVPPGDAGALAQALARVISDADFRRRAAQAGPLRARRYHVHPFVDRLEEIYDEAVTAAANSPTAGLAVKSARQSPK